MKPSLKMEDAKINVAIQPTATVEKKRQSKVVVGAILGIVAFLVVSGVVVGAFLIGAHTTRETFKVGHARSRDGGLVTVKVSEDLEVISGKEMTTVYDFRRGLVTQKSMLAKICLVSPMSPELQIPPMQLEEALSDDMEVSDKHQLRLVYMTEKLPVSAMTLSDTSVELCAGMPIYWATLIGANVTKIDGRQKRQIFGGSLPTSDCNTWNLYPTWPFGGSATVQASQDCGLVGTSESVLNLLILSEAIPTSVTQSVALSISETILVAQNGLWQFQAQITP